MLMPENRHGVRAISLARFGAFEVRLIELADGRASDDQEFCIELYRHDNQSSLDSYRCRDFEEAEPLAEQLISCARQLHKSYFESETSRRSAVLGATDPGDLSDRNSYKELISASTWRKAW
jgi:hypothetical protein